MANTQNDNLVDLQNLGPTDKDGPVVKKNLKVERVSVRLTGELGNMVRELEKETSATSPSDVVRRALVIYHKLVQQRLVGNQPIIEVRSGKKIKKIPIFL